MTAINQDNTTQVIDATPAAAAEPENPQAQPPVVSPTPADADAMAADAVVGDIALEDPLTSSVQPLFEAVRDQERMSVEIQNASGVADALQDMQESMGVAFNREGVSRAESEALQVAIEALAIATGIPLDNSLSFESHDRRRHDNAQLVMEGIGDVVKGVIDAIIRAIAWAIQTLKDFAEKLLVGAKQLKSKAQALKERLNHTGLTRNPKNSIFYAENTEDAKDGVKSDKEKDTTLDEKGNRTADADNPRGMSTGSIPAKLAILAGPNDKVLKLGPDFVGRFESYVKETTGAKGKVWSLYSNIERQFDDLVKSVGEDDESFKAAANLFAKNLSFADHGLEKTKAIEVPEGMVALIEELPFGHMSIVHTKIQDTSRGWELLGKVDMQVRRTPGQDTADTDGGSVTQLAWEGANRVLDGVIAMADNYLKDGTTEKQVQGLTKLMNELKRESKKIASGSQARTLRHAAEAFTRMLTHGTSAKRAYDIRIGLAALTYVGYSAQSAKTKEVEDNAKAAAGAA